MVKRLSERQFYEGDDFITNALNVYRALKLRHGVMVVGAPVTGKTTLIKLLAEVTNQINREDFKIREYYYRLDRAAALDIKVKTLDDYRLKIM